MTVAQEISQDKVKQIQDAVKPYISNEQIMPDNTIIWDVSPVSLISLADELAHQDVHHLSLVIGLETEKGLELRYVFSLPKNGSLEHQKAVAKVLLASEDVSVPSIQQFFPVAVFHEREAYDMLGISFEPKNRVRRIELPDPLPEDVHPLRKKYTYQQLAEIVKVESEKRSLENPNGTEPIIERADYAVVVGPQHPTHKEPIRFIFHISGETVQDVDLRVGFNYRGIEKAFESRTWNQNLYLVERICGICSCAHQLCMAEVVEKVAGVVAPERAQWIRVIIAELERIHSHILWYGVLAHDAGYDTLFHLTWRDREIVMDELERISGNRVNYAMMQLGGVRRDIPKDSAQKILERLAELRKNVLHHKEIMEKETSFIKRLSDVAPFSVRDALDYSAVGPTLRATGVKHDLRKADPSPRAYKDIPFAVYTGSTGDVYDTLAVRMNETLESIDMITYALDFLPSGEITTKFKARLPVGEAFNRVEAPRGEDMHFVRSTGGTGPDRYRVRAPTLQNIPSLVKRLQGIQVADIPVAIRSIDPCIGCMDRLTFVNSSGSVIEMTGPQLIKRSFEKYTMGRNVI